MKTAASRETKINRSVYPTRVFLYTAAATPATATPAATATRRVDLLRRAAGRITTGKLV